MNKIKAYITMVISAIIVFHSSFVVTATQFEIISANGIRESASETLVPEVEEVSANEIVPEINNNEAIEKTNDISDEIVAAEKAGNSFLSATSSAVNSNIYGTITDYSESHYYKFTLPSAGAVSMQFSHPVYESYNEGWWLSLYDANQKKIDSMLSSDGYVESVTGTYIGLPAGTYYVVVEYNYSGCLDNVYTLRLNYTTSNAWETEFNDGWLSADEITTGVAYYGTTIDYDDDDYYKFTLPSAGIVSIQFTHPLYESTNEGWYLSLYDANHNKIDAFSSFDGYMEKVNGPDIGLPAGTYYALVEYNNSVCLDKVYTLCINYTQSNVWETEFNDGWLSADMISTNVTYHGTTTEWCENDYYKFTIKSGRMVWLYFEHTIYFTSDRGWYIKLYDANHNVIDTFYSSYGTDGGVCTEDYYLPAGTYYLLVDENCENYGIDYSFSVNTQPDVGTIVTYEGLKYKVAKNGTKCYMQCVGPVNKSTTKATIKSGIYTNGFYYPIAQIKSSAFKNCKKLTKVVIGDNMKTIGASAFYGCKKLKSITIQSKKLHTIKSKAFSGIVKNVKIKVPKSKKSKYEKLLKKAGVKSTAVYK